MVRTNHLGRAVLTIMLLLIAFGKVNAQTLVLWHADGSTTDVELLTQPKVLFENGKVLITSTVLDMEYPKESIVRFTFKGTTSYIKDSKKEADYSNENGRLVFHGIKQTEKVAVYKVNGIRVPVQLTRIGEDIVLSLSQIPKGIYLLSVNGYTSKFTRP